VDGTLELSWFIIALAAVLELSRTELVIVSIEMAVKLMIDPSQYRCSALCCHIETIEFDIYFLFRVHLLIFCIFYRVSITSTSKHQRNRSLDSVLQKIPELEPDVSGSASADGHLNHNQPHHRSVDQTSTSGRQQHPPLKPSLSLSLDPCSNLFRFKESRR